VHCFWTTYDDVYDLHCPESENIEVHSLNNLPKNELMPMLEPIMSFIINQSVEHFSIKTKG
jgi:hypothetical protein